MWESLSGGREEAEKLLFHKWEIARQDGNRLPHSKEQNPLHVEWTQAKKERDVQNSLDLGINRMSTLTLLKTGEDVYYHGSVLSYTAAFPSTFITEGERSFRH